MSSPAYHKFLGAIFGGHLHGDGLGAPARNPPEFGVNLQQQVIDAHNADAIDARLKEYKAAPKLFYYKDAGVNCVAVGSSPRFPNYDVDFGFGKPKRVRSDSNNKFDEMMYLYTGRDGGRSIDAEIIGGHGESGEERRVSYD